MTGYSLHVGLNVVDTTSYVPAPSVLAGCVNDANDMARIAAAQGFLTRTMLDGQATSSAVLAALGDLARTTVSGDIALITYSGHGGQIGDSNGDEEDSLDETWCCYDRQVVDDELYRMWAQFPAGVRILVFSDSCHSGTVARSIMAIATREALVRNPLGEEYWPEEVKVERLRPRAMPPSVAAADFSRRRDVYSAAQAVSGQTRSTDIAAEVLLISGCQDNQLSSDGDVNGLFTEKVLRVWNNGSFSGDYRAFHSAIVRQMPPDQTPNLYTVGTVSAGFQAQRPFTITPPPPSGGGGGGWGQPTNPTPTTRRTLRQGDSGEDVRYLQQRLVDNGAWLSVDGQFGSITASAVRSFQASHGLTADGVVGPQTWAALEGSSGGGSVSGGGSGSWNTGGGSGNVSGGGSGSWGGGSGSWGDGGGSGGGSGGWSGGWGDNSGGGSGGSTGGGGSSGNWGNNTGGSGGSSGSSGGGVTSRPTIRRGSTGEHVRYLQQRLSELGYWLTVDGQFGSGTESQVRSFQRSYGLTADGIVGPATWAALG